MNAFCASENFDAFIVCRSSQQEKMTAENSSFKRSSLSGADHVPWQKPDSHRRHDIIMPAEAAEDPARLRVEDRDCLLRSIVIARRWMQELMDGAVADLPELARREGRSERSVRMTLSLAFLDPAIVAAICDRRLPRGYGVTKLADLPPGFDDQWRALGLPRPT